MKKCECIVMLLTKFKVNFVTKLLNKEKYICPCFLGDLTSIERCTFSIVLKYSTKLKHYDKV